ncbi:hypothetical protein DdX_11820 [Ditylenchus destructor]|uniref:Zinc knuckle domain-containing protein n=1 Tax=Ditylenchus destructor TaxID=166010 RepID=A0AAD4MVG9_9BILA|nr:hypothetical protein DdX_11820 [Ditylenchus destructor]
MLRERSQWTHRAPRLENSTSPKMGRIAEVFETPNGIRTAKVFMGKDSTLTRPVNKLYSLEVTDPTDDTAPRYHLRVNPKKKALFTAPVLTTPFASQQNLATPLGIRPKTQKWGYISSELYLHSITRPMAEENLIEFLCKELAVSVPDLKSNLWDETIRNWAEKAEREELSFNCHPITLGSSYSHAITTQREGATSPSKTTMPSNSTSLCAIHTFPFIAVQGGGTHENLYPMEILTISSLQPVLQPPAAQESTELPDQAPPTAAGPILSDQQTSRSSSPSNHQPGAQPADQRSPTDQQNVTVTVGGGLQPALAASLSLCAYWEWSFLGHGNGSEKSPLINLEISRTDSPLLGLMSNLLTEIDINTAAFHQTAPLAINSTADFSMAEGNGAAKREQGEALRKSIRELRRRRDPALAPAITTLREQFEQLNLEGPEGQLTDTTASASSSSESSSSRSSSKSEGELAEPSKQLKLAEPAKVLKKPTPPRVAAKRPPVTSLVHSEAKEAKEKKCSACNKMGHISTNRNCPARRGEYRIPLKRRRGTPTYRSPLSREPPSHNNTAPSTSRVWNSTQPSTSRAGNSNLSRQDIRRICQTEILHAFEDFVKKLLRDLEGRR